MGWGPPCATAGPKPPILAVTLWGQEARGGRGSCPGLAPSPPVPDTRIYLSFDPVFTAGTCGTSTRPGCPGGSQTTAGQTEAPGDSGACVPSWGQGTLRGTGALWVPGEGRLGLPCTDRPEFGPAELLNQAQGARHSWCGRGGRGGRSCS